MYQVGRQGDGGCSVKVSSHAPRRGTDLIVVTRGPAATIYRCRVCGFHASGRDPQAKTTAYAVLRRHVSGSHRKTYQTGLPAAAPGGAA